KHSQAKKHTVEQERIAAVEQEGKQHVDTCEADAAAKNAQPERSFERAVEKEEPQQKETGRADHQIAGIGGQKASNLIAAIGPGEFFDIQSIAEVDVCRRAGRIARNEHVLDQTGGDDALCVGATGGGREDRAADRVFECIQNSALFIPDCSAVDIDLKKARFAR